MIWKIDKKLSWRPSALVRALGMVAAAGLMISGLSGCGEPTYSIPTVYPVKGQVLLPDGKPLTSGQVVLVSKQDREFPGKLGSDGRFSIKTPSGEGAPEGEYTVRIEPESQAGGGGRTRTGTVNFPFPVKYTDDSTSGLKVTVKPGENNLEPIKLVPGPSAARSSTGKGSNR